MRKLIINLLSFMVIFNMVFCASVFASSKEAETSALAPESFTKSKHDRKEFIAEEEKSAKVYILQLIQRKLLGKPLKDLPLPKDFYLSPDASQHINFPWFFSTDGRRIRATYSNSLWRNYKKVKVTPMYSKKADDLIFRWVPVDENGREIESSARLTRIDPAVNRLFTPFDITEETPGSEEAGALKKDIAKLLQGAMKPGESLRREIQDGDYRIEVLGINIPRDDRLRFNRLSPDEQKKIDKISPPVTKDSSKPFVMVRVTRQEKKEQLGYIVLYPARDGISSRSSVNKSSYIPTGMFRELETLLSAGKPRINRTNFKGKIFSQLISYAAPYYFRENYIGKRNMMGAFIATLNQLRDIDKGGTLGESRLQDILCEFGYGAKFSSYQYKLLKYWRQNGIDIEKEYQQLSISGQRDIDEIIEILVKRLIDSKVGIPKIKLNQPVTEENIRDCVRYVFIGFGIIKRGRFPAIDFAKVANTKQASRTEIFKDSSPESITYMLNNLRDEGVLTETEFNAGLLGIEGLPRDEIAVVLKLSKSELDTVMKSLGVKLCGRNVISAPPAVPANEGIAPIFLAEQKALKSLAESGVKTVNLVNPFNTDETTREVTIPKLADELSVRMAALDPKDGWVDMFYSGSGGIFTKEMKPNFDELTKTANVIDSSI